MSVADALRRLADLLDEAGAEATLYGRPWDLRAEADSLDARSVPPPEPPGKPPVPSDALDGDPPKG